MRWDPWQEEWVVMATHRQDRPLMPRVDCPFCPGGLETPSTYQIAVFQNRYPSFRIPAAGHLSDFGPPTFSRREPAFGLCEVVLYTPEHHLSLSDLSPAHLLRLAEVWKDRWLDLSSIPGISYVYEFENKGEAIGVTLSHPHGQIYAFPFIPPRVERALGASRDFHQREGTCLACLVLEEELSLGDRVVAADDHFAALVPYWARWPFEVHLLPRRHLGSLAEMTEEELRAFAFLLRRVLRGFDNLYGYPFPYIMSLFPKPSDEEDHSHWHFRLEFYPPMRAADRQKIPAGCEVGAGTFLNDTSPESSAESLRLSLQRSERDHG